MNPFFLSLKVVDRAPLKWAFRTVAVPIGAFCAFALAAKGFDVFMSMDYQSAYWRHEAFSFAMSMPMLIVGVMLAYFAIRYRRVAAALRLSLSKLRRLKKRLFMG